MTVAGASDYWQSYNILWLLHGIQGVSSSILAQECRRVYFDYLNYKSLQLLIKLFWRALFCSFLLWFVGKFYCSVVSVFRYLILSQNEIKGAITYAIAHSASQIQSQDHKFQDLVLNVAKSYVVFISALNHYQFAKFVSCHFCENASIFATDTKSSEIIVLAFCGLVCYSWDQPMTRKTISPAVLHYLF